MTSLLLSLAAGVMTVLSPCVLPGLPMLFARSGSALSPIAAGGLVGISTGLLWLRRLAGHTALRLPTLLRATLPRAGGGRRLPGSVVLAAVALIATGRDAALAGADPNFAIERLEQTQLDHLPLTAWPSSTTRSGASEAVATLPAWLPVAATGEMPLPVLGTMPPLSGATAWLRSHPLSPADLRGKVVLVDVWTFGCINCQRALPSVREWARRYRDDGLVVIGVHTPEFAFERERGNVERALLRMDLGFPIAMDNDFAVWKAWSNQYWPTLYLIDAQGRLRWRHIGEGAYAQTEQAIRQLLDEARRHPASRS